MFRRRPGRGAQQVAPQGCPRSGGLRRRRPQLPRLPAARGAGAARAPGGGGSWWQELDPAGPAARRPAPATPAARGRPGPRSLRLPPLLPPGSPCGSRPRPPRAREGEAPDSLGALLGGVLPGKFREFLQQLYRKCAESPEPQLPSAPPRPRRGVSKHLDGPGSLHSSCPVLPDLWGQSSHFQDRFKKILFHQIPVLGHLRSDHSQFATVRQANQLRGTQACKAKAVLSPCSSREGLGSRRRCCPFRVRFADETLRDSALRYWERCCAAVQPDLNTRTTALPVGSEQVLGSVGRWLESLPKPLHPRGKEAAKASSSSWAHPSTLTEELQENLSKDACMSSSLPFIPKATTQSQWGDLKTSLEQLGKLPCSWTQKLESFLPSLVLQSVLKRGRPKDYQLLLPFKALQRAQR